MKFFALSALALVFAQSEAPAVDAVIITPSTDAFTINSTVTEVPMASIVPQAVAESASAVPSAAKPSETGSATVAKVGVAGLLAAMLI
jgi:hypothetical protein